MPIYEYRCRSCDRKSEVFFRLRSDHPSVTCRYCQSTDLERLISTFAHVKGEANVVDRFGPPPPLDSPKFAEYYSRPGVADGWNKKALEAAKQESPKATEEGFGAAEN